MLGAVLLTANGEAGVAGALALPHVDPEPPRELGSMPSIKGVGGFLAAAAITKPNLAIPDVVVLIANGKIGKITGHAQ